MSVLFIVPVERVLAIRPGEWGKTLLENVSVVGNDFVAVERPLFGNTQTTCLDDLSLVREWGEREV